MPKSNTAVVTIGIDPGKNTLHLVGLDARGGIVLREKVARARIVSRLANVPPSLIGIEAGMGTHYVTRELLALGHDVRQVPPVYAKPFRQTHKNDFRSICRRCIVCATAWWGNGPRSSIRSDAFSWSTASR
jgi:transposase